MSWIFVVAFLHLQMWLFKVYMKSNGKEQWNTLTAKGTKFKLGYQNTVWFADPSVWNRLKWWPILLSTCTDPVPISRSNRLVYTNRLAHYVLNSSMPCSSSLILHNHDIHIHVQNIFRSSDTFWSEDMHLLRPLSESEDNHHSQCNTEHKSPSNILQPYSTVVRAKAEDQRYLVFCLPTKKREKQKRKKLTKPPASASRAHFVP